MLDSQLREPRSESPFSTFLKFVHMRSVHDAPRSRVGVGMNRSTRGGEVYSALSGPTDWILHCLQTYLIDPETRYIGFLA